MKTSKIFKIAVFMFLLCSASGITAQSVKFDSAIFDQLCSDVLREWKLPGMAVVVVKDGQKIFLKGYGTTAIDSTGTPVTPQTQFVIASTSKAFTAALLATVIDEGHLKWSDTVKNHLPDFKLYDHWATENFLVRDIMVHKTGFRAYATDDLPHFGYNRDEIYTLHRHLRPTYSFRTTYAYNNSLYTVSAKLIEKYSGMSWDDAIVKRIFEPLEMRSSTTGNVSFFTSDRLAAGHAQSRSGDTLRVSLRTDKERAFRWLSAVAPAGFVISTAEDMGNWITMHLNKGEFNGKRVLSRENHNYLFVPQTITGSDSVTLNNYAQGWTVEQGPAGRLIRHTGLAYGYTALVGLLPEMNMGFAILVNAGSTTNPHYAIAREMIEMCRGEETRDWREFYLSAYMRPRENPAPKEQTDSIAPLNNISYEGEFFMEDFGTVTISIEDDILHFSLKDVKSPMKHKNGDKFTISARGTGIEVEFFRDCDNKINGLTFDIGDPIGTFKRMK